MKLSILFVVAFMALTTHCTLTFGQTYASDSLKNAAESDIKAKNARLGIKEVTPTETKVEEKYERFDYSVISSNSFKLKTYESAATQDIYSKDAIQNHFNQINSKLSKIEMIIDLDKKILFYIEKESLKFSQISFEFKENKIVFLNCGECNDLHYLVVSKTNESIILDIPSQDEGVYINSRLYFINNN